MATPKPHILFIEDDTFLSSIYAQKFELEGFEISFATNGQDGLKLAAKDHPSAILLDLRLQADGMDGFTVLETLKKDPESKNIPVLVLSNLAQKEDVERCFKLGAAGYLIKAHTLPHEAVTNVKTLIHVAV